MLILLRKKQTTLLTWSDWAKLVKIQMQVRQERKFPRKEWYGSKFGSNTCAEFGISCAAVQLSRILLMRPKNSPYWKGEFQMVNLFYADILVGWGWAEGHWRRSTRQKRQWTVVLLAPLNNDQMNMWIIYNFIFIFWYPWWNIQLLIGLNLASTYEEIFNSSFVCRNYMYTRPK